MPKFFRVATLLGLMLAARFEARAQTYGQTVILAASGDKMPDGDAIQTPDSFALSSNGMVFQAYLKTAKLSAVFSSTLAGTKTEILRDGNKYLDGTYTLTGFAGNLWTNNNSQALVLGNLTDAAGATHDALLMGSNTANTKPIIVAGQTALDGNGQYYSFGPGTMNDAGQVGIWASIQNGGGAIIDTNAVYRWSPDGTMVQLGRSGQTAPGETLKFHTVGGGLINQSGQVCVTADMIDAQAAFGYAYAVYRATSATDLVRVARSGLPAPGTGYLIYDPLVGAMNNAGVVSFYTDLLDSANAFHGQAICKAAEINAITTIAYVGQAAPNGLGAYTHFDNSLGINDAGQVAFVGYYQNGSATGSGLFIGDGATQRQLLLAGQATPDGHVFKNFGLARALNDGTVVFTATTDTATDFDSIYLTDGVDTVKVIHAGDTVGTAKVNQVGFDPKTINDLHQVVFQGGGSSTSLKILLFTPYLNWRVNGDGNWTDSANWTASLVPATNNDATLAPNTGGKVTGPASAATVKSLKIGAATSGTAELGLRAGAITAAGGVTVATRGRLSGAGRVVGNVVNQAVVAPGITVGTITVQGNYTQASTAGLEIKVGGPTTAACDSLAVTGSATLAGTLKVSLTADALNRVGPNDTLTILSATGTLTGAFSNAPSTAGSTRLATSDGYGSFQVNYLAHAVTLSNFAAVDSDGDGIPDGWAQRYFGHASGQESDRSRASDDADGDGVSNLAEYIAGTSPVDGASSLRATMSSSSGGFTVSFPTLAGRTYTVESSTGLGTANWTPSVTGIAGDGTVKTIPLAPPSSFPATGFYRVSVSR